MPAALTLRTPASAPGAWQDTYLAPTDFEPLAARPLGRLSGFQDGRRVSADNNELLHIASGLDLPWVAKGGGPAEPGQDGAVQEAVLWSSAILGRDDGSRVQQHLGVQRGHDGVTLWTARLRTLSAFPGEGRRRQARTQDSTYRTLDEIRYRVEPAVTRYAYKNGGADMLCGHELTFGTLTVSRLLRRIISGEAQLTELHALPKLSSV